MANNMNNILALDTPTIIIPEEDVIVLDNTPRRTRNIVYDQPIPTLREVENLSMPSYHGGKRLPTNSFGTINLSGISAQSSSEEVLASFDSNFRVYKDYVYPDVDANGHPMEGSERIPILRRDDTNQYLCTSTENYHTIDYTDAVDLFFAILNEIKRHGYTAEPAYAKRYNPIAKATGGKTAIFLQYRICGNELVGEDAETYLTLLTSHDAKLSLTLCLSMVRLFCQNQVNRCLKKATSKWTVRHSSLAKAKMESVMGASKKAAIAAGIGEAQHTLNMIQENLYGMNAYLEYLSKIKVSEQNIFDTMVKLSTLKGGNNNSSSAVTHFLNKAAQLKACYQMEDVDKWRGTALGAYYAFSDMSDHVKGKGNMDTYFMRHMDGNADLERFADTLVEIAK